MSKRKTKSVLHDMIVPAGDFFSVSSTASATAKVAWVERAIALHKLAAELERTVVIVHDDESDTLWCGTVPQ